MLGDTFDESQKNIREFSLIKSQYPSPGKVVLHHHSIISSSKGLPQLNMTYILRWNKNDTSTTLKNICSKSHDLIDFPRQNTCDSKRRQNKVSRHTRRITNLTNLELHRQLCKGLLQRAVPSLRLGDQKGCHCDDGRGIYWTGIISCIC